MGFSKPVHDGNRRRWHRQSGPRGVNQKKKKKWKHVSVSRNARIACCKALQWKKIALLCVTAVSNGNVELKVGVLPVRLAVTLHVLFPPLACFLFLGLLHVLSRMASLPPQWKGRKKKKSIQNTACWCCFIKASRHTISPPPPFMQTCVTGSAGRQWLENVLCVLEDTTLFFFFFCGLKSDRWGERHFFCNYFHLSAPFSGNSLFPSFPVDITQAGGSRSRARLESNWGRFKSPLRPSIMTCTGPHVRKH